MQQAKLLVAGLVLGIGLSACGRDSATNTTTAPSEPPPVATAPSAPTAPPVDSGTAMSNSEMENVIKTRLQSDEQLRAADLDVDVDADKREVTISGTVASQELRNRAVDLAKNTHPGVVVNDKIDVKPAA